MNGLFEDELTEAQIRALLHVYDYNFCPLQNVRPGGRFEKLDFVQWFDLYVRGLIYRTKGEKSIELTTEGVKLLANGGWL